MLELDRFHDSDDIIIERAFGIARYYCDNGAQQTALDIHMSTYSLSETDKTTNVRHRMRNILKDVGIAKAPDTWRLFLK